MGTGWRRAFCTSIPRDTDAGGEKKVTPPVENPSSSPSPRSCVKLGFFSNPSTPRLRIRTTAAADEKDVDKDTPRLQCKTTPTAGAITNNTKSPRVKAYSNPSSPRSPSRFALLRSLRLSRVCGDCKKLSALFLSSLPLSCFSSYHREGERFGRLGGMMIHLCTTFSKCAFVVAFIFGLFWITCRPAAGFAWPG